MLRTACMLNMVVCEMIIGQYRVYRSSCDLALSNGSFPEGLWEFSETGVSLFSLMNSPKSWDKKRSKTVCLRKIIWRLFLVRMR